MLLRRGGTTVNQAILSKSTARKGKLWAVLVYALPLPTYFVICWFTHSVPAKALGMVATSPLSFLGIAILLGTLIFWIFRGFRPFEQWHHNPDRRLVESLQKRLIAFPKRILAVGLVYGLVVSGLVVLSNPALQDRWIDFLVLGYANSIFVSMPCYILFLQAFERWNRDLPFSSRHLSMSLQLRVNLVTGFVLTSILSMVLVAFKNVLDEGKADPAWALILEVGLPIALIGLAGGVLNIALLMNGIVGRIHRAKDFVLDLSDGDVSKPVLELTSRDELGQLAAHLNLVHQNLNTLLGSTMQSVGKTVSIKDELVTVCSSTADQIGRIGEQVSLVDGQAQGISEAVDRALGRVKRVHEVIGGLNGEINRQGEMIQETSSSLEQMTEGIENIARISTSRMESSRDLEGQTVEGQAKMKATLGRLTQIAASVEDIRGITGVIQDISAQTNLLSMNAAIEAAHAGRAGAGFAVVADEIRKLAETSSKSSKEITTKIQAIILAIAQAVESGGETASTFDKIRHEMAEFLGSFREIETTMGEMRSGSATILSASLALKEVSEGVRTKSGLLDQEADGLFEDIDGLKSKAHATRRAMSEVGTHMTGVHTSSETLEGHTRQLDESTREVSSHLQRFRVL